MAEHPHAAGAPPRRVPQPRRHVKYLPMLTFTPGEAVRIHRPKHKQHGWVGRYIEAGPHANLAYIAFNDHQKAKPLGSQLPKPEHLLNQSLSPRTLFPLSQILKYEPAPPL